MNDVVDKARAWDELAKKNAEIERLRAGLRSAQLQLSIALQGVPPQLETLELGFRRAYDMICAALRDEQKVSADD
jgi:hypothetical protein